MIRTHAGFTLIELLMTLAVMALLAGISAPSMGRLLTRTSVSSAHNLVMTGFATARLHAVTQGRSVTVCPGDAAGGCRAGGRWDGGWILFVDRNGDDRFDPEDTLLRVENPVSPRLAIQSNSNRPRAVFRPNGMSGGANLTLRICAEGAVQSAVILSNAGRARAATSSELATMSACS
jgi:type IV fimbrial biogenesis protein FimT